MKLDDSFDNLIDLVVDVVQQEGVERRPQGD